MCFTLRIDRGAGEVIWSLQWGEVLAPELRSKPGSPGDHLNLHTRMPAPPYDIKCASPPQAQQLLQAVQRQLVSLLHIRIMNTELNGTSIEDAATPLEQVPLSAHFPCVPHFDTCTQKEVMVKEDHDK